jgi:hypothetical protein
MKAREVGVPVQSDESLGERIISSLGAVPILGRLLYLDRLTANALATGFQKAFTRDLFLSSGSLR